MSYGGMRRRPGPLLGGSAILTQRSNQQKMQYLQQLENIVRQKEQQHNYTNSMVTVKKSSPQMINNSSQKLGNIMSEHVDHTSPEQNPLTSKQENNNCPPEASYPDLLSHEVPQHRTLISNQQHDQINQGRVVHNTPVQEMLQMSSNLGNYVNLFLLSLVFYRLILFTLLCLIFKFLYKRC